MEKNGGIKMFKRGMASVLVFAMVFTILFSMPIIQAKAVGETVIAADSTVVVSRATAGLKTVITDTGDGFVTVVCNLKGLVNLTCFEIGMSYDKTKVVPVSVATKTDMGNVKTNSELSTSPYFQNMQTAMLSGYYLAPYTIENTTGAGTGNYFVLGYAQGSGALIKLAANSELPMIKMYFRKIGAIDSNTFAYYHKVYAGTVVSKFVYLTTNVLQYETSTGTNIFTRPDLFTIQNINIPTASSTPTPTPTSTLGDVNNDGNITAVDALMALQAASGKIVLTANQKFAGDITNDGNVTAVDALMILQYASGKTIWLLMK